MTFDFISYEAINSIVGLVTLVILVASVIAAAISLHHSQAFNQISAVLSMERDMRTPDMQEAFRFVQSELPYKLYQEEFRAELDAIGFIDSRSHLEIQACNWFNAMGTLLKHNLVEEGAWMDLFSRLVVNYWDRLSPVIAILRRRRGNSQYANFEYVAIRAREWLEKNPHGTFPPKMARAKVVDRWLEQDSALVAERRLTDQPQPHV
ncbi:MAG: hypothetical protein DLM53_02920 [Candidatus Eremiobacter antarcticus]|nr:hypothetical protein [Candidatus Eremiobacteraeota bacterium]MBC5808364.1 hypothetical protein [Candidatus Eremiobacteraeota bacterium]PZR63731.1 MAG: hypothetical protein DLM53_02920 [Candidatus Eremiobacter sp. RRmetagenome_bin22]